MNFPKILKDGGLIYLLAPSSPLSKDQPVEGIATAVERLGFRVRIGKSCRGWTPRGYAAAAPELRAEDINLAFSSPDVDAIWCVRGGSTAWQVLPYLDYELIRANPKPFIGYSDITTLHLAFQQRCSLATFHGPTANGALKWKPEDFSWRSLWAALGSWETLAAENPPGEPIDVLRPGKANGVLTGGNLSLIAAGMGTPWQIDAKGKILYLEDTGEDVYSLDEMLSQLKYGGIFDGASGVLLGAFTNCQNTYNEDFGPQELLRDFFRDYPGPVVCNLRSAHCSPKSTLPLGAVCYIDGCTVKFRRF